MSLARIWRLQASRVGYDQTMSPVRCLSLGYMHRIVAISLIFHPPERDCQEVDRRRKECADPGLPANCWFGRPAFVHQWSYPSSWAMLTWSKLGIRNVSTEKSSCARRNRNMVGNTILDEFQHKRQVDWQEASKLALRLIHKSIRGIKICKD